MLKLSLPVRLAISALLNCLFVFFLDRYLPQYFSVYGGPAGFVVIGSLLTLMNLFLRPLLSIITFPLHLLFTLATTILVNAFFLWVVHAISLQLDPNLVAFDVLGGAVGWLIISCVFGMANWMMKHVL